MPPRSKRNLMTANSEQSSPDDSGIALSSSSSELLLSPSFYKTVKAQQQQRRRSSNGSSATATTVSSEASRESVRRLHHMELLTLLHDESEDPADAINDSGNNHISINNNNDDHVEYESSPLRPVHEEDDDSCIMQLNRIQEQQPRIQQRGSFVHTFFQQEAAPTGNHAAAKVASFPSPTITLSSYFQQQQQKQQQKNTLIPPFCAEAAGDAESVSSPSSSSSSSASSSGPKQVTFCPIGPTILESIHLKDYTDEECDATWYTRKELKRIHVHSLRDVQSASSTRGLEMKTSNQFKSSVYERRANVWNAVFDEQERQWKESYNDDIDDDDYIFEYDEDRIAHVSFQHSQSAQILAYRFGRSDYREARLCR